MFSDASVALLLKKPPFGSFSRILFAGISFKCFLDNCALTSLTVVMTLTDKVISINPYWIACIQTKSVVRGTAISATEVAVRGIARSIRIVGAIYVSGGGDVVDICVYNRHLPHHVCRCRYRRGRRVRHWSTGLDTPTRSRLAVVCRRTVTSGHVHGT